MGAAASTSGSRELRGLHSALTKSGTTNRTVNMSDLEKNSHMARIDRLVDRLILAERTEASESNEIGEPIVRIDQIEPGYKTTLMYAAATAGGEECLAVIHLLRKHAISDDHFIRALSWRNPQTGLTVLHAARDGKAAAVLLRAGCQCLETREFEYGMTPLQWAAKNDNVNKLAVLHAWGATNRGPPETATNNHTATDIALWNTVPERPYGNMAWLILHDLISMSRFSGIQFMMSPKISKVLQDYGVDDIPPPPLPDRRNPGDGHKEKNTTTTYTQHKSDYLEIRHLPAEYKRDAHLFDTDHSGRITVDELKKMIRLKEKLRGIEGMDDLLIDRSRFNSIGGGDFHIQCQQRGISLEKVDDETKDVNLQQRTRRSPPTFSCDLNPDLFEFWEDPESKIPKFVTTTVGLAFDASLPMENLNFSKKIADEQVEKSNMRRKLNSKFKSNMGRSQEKEKLEEERRLFLLNTKEPAGKTSGACQRYGAESGDAPSWLKTTSHSSRSEDQLRTYLGTHPVHTQCSIPKSYRSDPSMQHGSSWENQKVEKNKTFASALRSTLKKEAIEEYEEHSDHSLWRPIGNRCIKSGITEEDHICLDRNPKMFTNVRVDSLLQNRRR